MRGFFLFFFLGGVWVLMGQYDFEHQSLPLILCLWWDIVNLLLDWVPLKENYTRETQ